MTLLGTSVGRIRLVDHLGKGGMGEVFVGYDETLDRKVAVKCVRVGERLSDKLKARFLQEARILSRLEHPNICQIYDFVEGDGRDFLVMELVEGRGLKEAAREGLDRKTTLEIAQRVAGVLVAAHAEGVVHRDLKPEHVMITEAGEVKVLDFGVAHSSHGEADVTLDLSSNPLPKAPLYRTLAGSVVGTPRYMSPEQARGEPVTPASDMYTFGLLMQELFTGEAPYATGKLEETLAEVGAGHNRPTVGLDSPLTELIEGLKALNPSKRPSAKETADRLRFIRETPLRRLRRAAVAAAVILIFAGIMKYTVDLRRERAAAVAACNQAEDLVTFMLEDLSEELRPAGRLDVLDKVARQALGYYEKAESGSAGEAAFRRGSAFFSVAEVLRYQGDLDAAVEATESALATHQRLVDERPERADWRNGLVHDQLRLAGLVTGLGDRERAHKLLLAARDLAKGLVEEEKDNVEWQQTLGEAHYSFGLYDLSHDLDAAAAAFREAIVVYEQLAQSDPEELSYKFRLAVFYGQGLGQVYQALGREADSFAAVRQAYVCYEKLTEADPGNNRWQHGFAWENRRLGGHLEDRGQLEEALAAYRRAKEISERLLRLEPTHVDWRLGLGADFSAIASIQESQGDLPAALDSLRHGLAITKGLAATDPARLDYRLWLADDQLAVGSILSRQGRVAEAREIWEQAAAEIATYLERATEVESSAYETQAVAMLYLGRVDEAKLAVEELQRRGWFADSASEEFIDLCRRHGLLPDA